MAEVVKSPTMPENEFKKLLAQARTGLAVQVKEPSYLADRQLRRQLYGDHPYARSAVGELEDLAALKRDDLAAWWDACARPDEATLIFAGDIDMARARKLADEHFGAWRAHGEAAHVELPAVPQPQKTHIYLVDYPGVQSQIRVGQIAFTRKDPAFFTSRVLSGYFGGAFSSRLNDTIRVKKGLTYGARGGFSAQRFSGKFAVSTFSKVATTAEAVRAIFDEIERLRNEPPSKKELDSAVSYTLGAFPATRETPQQLAGEVWLQRYADLPEDFFDQLLRGVASATAEECVELARARVSPNKMTVVVVGPASKLRADLAEIAPVTVVKP